MNHEAIRLTILQAVCSDPWLFDHLVLKGGNALTLIYKVSQRTSLDLDFSIAEDFDAQQAEQRLAEALRSSFAEHDMLVFDFAMAKKPNQSKHEWWGGYRAEFKIIANADARRLDNRPQAMRREALTTDPSSDRRKFSIEISKHEFVGDIREHRLGELSIRAYSPVLIAAEKLRAICQQHPEYALITKKAKRSRARDFYDIWLVCDHFTIELAGHHQVVDAVFSAKHVDRALVMKLDEVRALHEASWPDVELSVAGRLEPFDFYYGFVRSMAQRLHARWEEHAP